MVVIRMESRQRERNQRKLKRGASNESNTLQFLEEKNLFQNIKNSGELLLTQEIERTTGNSGDSRQNWETWTICRYYLHSLHGQLSGHHFLVSNLKVLKRDTSCVLVGTIFQFLGPKNLRLCIPLYIVLIFENENCGVWQSS